MKRHLLWNARITRREFAAYAVAWLGGCIALGFWQDSLPPGALHDFSKLLIWPLVAIIALAASKRCRDADATPWLGPAAVIVQFGILILLFVPGSKGRNRFGPDPRESPPTSDAPSH